jgi:hypothetical protein
MGGKLGSIACGCGYNYLNNAMMNIVVIIISGILGATVTFYISDKLKQSAVTSALSL